MVRAQVLPGLTQDGVIMGDRAVVSSQSVQANSLQALASAQAANRGPVNKRLLRKPDTDQFQAVDDERLLALASDVVEPGLDRLPQSDAGQGWAVFAQASIPPNQAALPASISTGTAATAAGGGLSVASVAGVAAAVAGGLVVVAAATKKKDESTPEVVDRAGQIAAIVGTATQGQTLRAGEISDLDGGVTGITYQWKAGDAIISGATQSSYTLTQAEVGKAITVVATYTDAQGPSKSVTSAATAAVADVDDVGSMGAISGEAIHGQTLTAGEIGDADGGVTGIAYQWQSDGVNIRGATQNTYLLAHTDVGKTITVVATYNDAHGPNKSATSAATSAIAIRASYTSTELANAYQQAAGAIATADDKSFYKAVVDQALQVRDTVGQDGRANGTNALNEYIDRVTGTDVVSAAEFDVGFSITGKTTAGATGVKFYLDNDRTNGLNEIGTALVHGTNGVSIDHNTSTGEYSISFAANSIALKQGVHGTAGSGIHKLTVDTDGNGAQNAEEASRLFLVASGTAQNSDTGLAAQNFSVQDTVTKNIFVYFYGDVDGNGVALWTQQDPTGSAEDRDYDQGFGGGFGDWDYFNTPGAGSSSAPYRESTADNTAMAYVTQSQAQTWEFAIGNRANGRTWVQANGDAGNHSLWNSNTSRMASLEELLAVYAANFSAGSRTTPGALVAVTDTSAYSQETNNTPAGWSNNFWTAAVTPSGHAFVYFNSGDIYDKAATGLADVAAIL
jgi:hypothetical protein